MTTWARFIVEWTLWELLVIGPPLLTLLHARAPRREDGPLVFSWFLVGLAGTGLVWLLTRRRWGPAFLLVFLAAVLGGALPVLGSLLWNALSPGFEESSARFIGSLLISGLSAIAGALVGWLRIRNLGNDKRSA